MQDLENFDIATREHKADPHPFYERLRAERPVCPVRTPDKRTIWLVTRYEDVAMVLKDERFVKHPKNVKTGKRSVRHLWFPKFARPLFERNMLAMDKPDHTRLRGLINKSFSPRLVDGMRSRIDSLTADLLDQVRDRRQFDLIRDYALPIPTTIIAEMLGIPARDGRKFNRWSNSLTKAVSNRWRMMRAVPDVWLFSRYIRKFVSLRQANPQDDLISEMIRAEENGERLDDDELVATAFLLVYAGHETTVNLIGNGVLALLEHPEQMELLRSEPNLIESAVEELLRYGSPVEYATDRFAREDVTIAGVDIPGGASVIPVLASANRDESVFPNPNTLDITREPNKHLAFGFGPHYCTGAPLARIEAQVAINALLQAAPEFGLNVAPSELSWRPSLLMRGLESLPIAVDRWSSSNADQNQACVASA